MRLFTKLLIAKLIIGYVIIALYLCLNWDMAKENLPLPVSAEKKTELVEQRRQLGGDPYEIQLWVNRYLEGKRDTYQYAQYPEETFERKAGDCMEENTRIITKDGIKAIKDIRVGDLILSYNYTEKRYEYKPVTKKWDKGILSGNIVKLMTGHSFIATDDHKFFVRRLQKNKQQFEIRKLQDIDETRWWKKQIHCVYKIPSGDIKVDNNLAYLYGVYISEGWGEKSHVCIAQDKLKIRYKIESALDNLDASYSKSRRKKHQYYTIKKSWLKEELKMLGTNSFNKIIPIEVLNWDKESIGFLLQGLIDGDGTDRRNIKSDSSLWEFSTSSDQVAFMFNILVRKVWGNCWFYKQINHQGVGKKPIFRLRFNPKGLSNKEIFKDISLVSIKTIEKIEGLHYYDIEVKDNHNFVLADSGVISHNCEDFAILSKYFLEERYNEVHIVVWEAKFTPESRNYEKRKRTLYHAIVLFKIKGGWGVMDNNGLLMAKGTMEDAIRFDCELRKMEVKRAYTARFNHYSWRKLERII